MEVCAMIRLNHIEYLDLIVVSWLSDISMKTVEGLIKITLF